MPYNQSTYIAGDSEPSVRLKCGNMRIGFLAICMIIWIFSLIFLCQMAEYSGLPGLAESARSTNNYFGHSSIAFALAPGIILALFLYFLWGRKNLVWFNGVLIDDKPKNVVYYEIKKTFNNVSLIYLQTPGRLYIIYPATSQDGRKFPDVKIMRKEAALNEIQVELLKEKLKNSSASEKNFRLFSNDVIISALVFVLIVATAFLAT